jgi:uncharacterized repeat protein (TIGR03803 family)
MCWKRACALLLFCSAVAIVSPAQTFTSLASFDSTNGAGPSGGSLLQAINGDLYGTTMMGGEYNYGTIFRITPAGVLTSLLSFNVSNGSYPGGGLVQATNGALYGTTQQGNNNYGTIFKLTSAGLTTLYSFLTIAEGTSPDESLVQAANGNLYGTTNYGGTNNCGTVFEITPAGELTILHNFDSTDGPYPSAVLVQAGNGDLYGTTIYGGTSDACNMGCGTVFKITTAGAYTLLHSFSSTDGSGPQAGLIQATNGDLYGTTTYGGTSDLCYTGCGTIFKITPAGVLTSLVSFEATNGANPYAPLVQATDGNLYGTTFSGQGNYGTIFKITPSGTLTTVHTFELTDGADPFSGLTQDTNGSLYGATYGGGANNDGTVYKLSIGVDPFVKTLPTVGLVGSAVRILGTDLTGATGVTFNGTATAFTVVSASEITTTVPTGATTGRVQVITPSRTLLSNVSFEVP